MNAQTYWEQIYQTKAPTQVSWYQEHSQISLELIQSTGIALDSQIIDVGSGASVLIDDLLDAGYRKLTVLDISQTALQTMRTRLGPRGDAIHWLEADITQVKLPPDTYDLWHDRAVFHFLLHPSDRKAYIQNVMRSVRPNGHVIIAAFATDGPTHCSGLEVMRYNSESLHDEFGNAFELLSSQHETHHTPFGTHQEFIYCYCRKQSSAMIK
jgi:ubiquinone/menaquinone biosynthesis C-methylase UbiE